MRDSRRIEKQPKPTPMGFMFSGNPGMVEGWFEPAETEIVKKLFAHTDVFINAGANIGYYTCWALSRQKHTVAFEPIERNLRFLYANVKANGWENNIEVFPMALSNKAGLVDIYGGGTGASVVKGWAGIPEGYVTTVPCSTLDTIIGQRFKDMRCLIVIDVEGAEKYLLEGANELLSRKPKPIWMVEISIGEHQPEGLGVNPHFLSTFERFWEKGYESWTADGNVRAVTPSEIATIANGGRDSLQTHNFLFFEKGRKAELLGG
jgi:FkbM family methyltransferase